MYCFIIENDKTTPTPKTETVKPRSDLSTSIFEQLTLPLREGQTSHTHLADSEINKLLSQEKITNGTDASSEIKVRYTFLLSVI